MRSSRWIVLLVMAALAPAGARAEQGPRRAKADAARGETKKPNPCASQGPGFAMLPGTATCVRIGGAVEGDLSVGRGSAPNLGVK